MNLNRVKKISCVLASVAGAVLLVSLYLPWMGLDWSGAGDISEGSKSLVSWGELPHPFGDQTAFGLDALIAGAMTAVGVAVMWFALFAGFAKAPLVALRTSGWILLAGGIAILAGAAALVFVIDSDPLAGFDAGDESLGFAWSALAGSKIAAGAGAVIGVCGVVLVGAGAAVVTSAEPTADCSRLSGTESRP